MRDFNGNRKKYEYTYAERLRLARWTDTKLGAKDCTLDAVYQLTNYYCNYLTLFKGLHDNVGDPYSDFEDDDRKALLRAEIGILKAQRIWLEEHYMEGALK